MSARRPPGDRGGLRIDVQSPFGRLALTHVLSVGGDALVAMSLAGSLFFDVDPSGARWRIFLYLVFTVAPFAVVGPLIGPAMDRATGGRRTMVLASAIGRCLLAVVMVTVVASNSLLLFPEAFFMLIMAKGYQVAKAAIVPTVVHGDSELVEANSKLQLLSGLGGFAAGAPGLLLLVLVGPGGAMGLAAVMFGAATVAGFRVPATAIAPEPVGREEKAELRSSSVLAAGSAMGTLRAVVGFVTFLMAFALRGSERITLVGEVMGRVSAAALKGPVSVADLAPPGAPPAWHFGVIVVVSVGGGLLGAAVAPVFRRGGNEEFLLLGALCLAALSGLGGLLLAGLFGQVILSSGVAVSASAGKQAFDAVVQRDAPDANRGRIFARFESRFQVAWVFGAVVPVVVPMPTQLGGLLVGCLAVAAAILFGSGVRAVSRGRPPPMLPGTIELGGRFGRRFGRWLRERGADAGPDSEPR